VLLADTGLVASVGSLTSWPSAPVAGAAITKFASPADQAQRGFDMTSKDELTGLFTIYFGDKISPAQIEDLAAGVVAAQTDRRARLWTYSSAPSVTR